MEIQAYDVYFNKIGDGIYETESSPHNDGDWCKRSDVSKYLYEQKIKTLRLEKGIETLQFLLEEAYRCVCQQMTDDNYNVDVDNVYNKADTFIEGLKNE